MTPTEIVLAAVTTIFTSFDPQAARELLAPDYIQHNPAVPTGAHAIIDLIPVLAESGIKVDVHRVIAEDDMVVVHSTYSNAQLLGSDTLVAFDVFRIEEGKVAEHWDNLQALAGPNPSGHSMTDGTTDITDEDKTAENKALVAAFVETVLQGGDASRITDFISTKTYIQHNPQIADGLDGLSEALAGLAEAGIDMVYARTPLIVAQGNFVFTGSEGRLGAEPTAFFDLFRLENGRIVEHWDTVSPIPERFAHGNGKF